MNANLKKKVMETEEVKEAMYDYFVATPDKKKLLQVYVGKTANMMACKILKDKGWSNKAIAEEVDIPEESVVILLATV